MWGLAMRAPSAMTSVSANRGSALSTTSASTSAARAPISAAAGRRIVVVAAAATESTGERLRLGNLSPAPGSRRPNKRKGRGHAAGQGGSCGFGMRGQKSRSGSGVRPGFEGGQTPLYRRVPKLKGIAGGMSAGVPKFVTVNVSQLEAECEAGSEVDIASLERLVGATGARAKLPLKVLGDGEIGKALTVKAASFSASARAKIEAAGGKAVVLEGKPKWVRASGKEQESKKPAAAAAAAEDKADE